MTLFCEIVICLICSWAITPALADPRQTLVSFAYSARPADTHDYSTEANLIFFLRNGVRAYQNFPGVHLQVVVALNGLHLCPEANSSHLGSVDDVDVYQLSHIGGEGMCGELRKAVDCCKLVVLRRDNVGYDFGAHGAILRSGVVNMTAYEHVIFLNGGVRGPFIAPVLQTPHMRAVWHWSMAFTDRLVGNTRLVSTSITCVANTKNMWAGMCVESFAFALDRVAIEKFLEVGTVFINHQLKSDAIINGEYGVSMVVRKEGWLMDTLLSSYQGIDWTDKQNWDCNRLQRPSREGTYFGISMHPYETVFHKSHWKGMPEVNWPVEKRLTEWQDCSREDNMKCLSFLDLSLSENLNPD